jgi:hypothetical protein
MSHVWRCDLEEVGRRLVAEGASLLVQGELKRSLAAFDNAVLLAPSVKAWAVSAWGQSRL